MSIRRRLERLEGHSCPLPTQDGVPWRTPEEEAERERQFDELWSQLHEEYGIERRERSHVEKSDRQSAFRKLHEQIARHRNHERSR